MDPLITCVKKMLRNRSSTRTAPTSSRNTEAIAPPCSIALPASPPFSHLPYRLSRSVSNIPVRSRRPSRHLLAARRRHFHGRTSNNSAAREPHAPESWCPGGNRLLFAAINDDGFSLDVLAVRSNDGAIRLRLCRSACIDCLFRVPRAAAWAPPVVATAEVLRTCWITCTEAASRRVSRRLRATRWPSLHSVIDCTGSTTDSSVIGILYLISATHHWSNYA